METEEREKVREEIRRFREKARMDMIRQEREDRLRDGWTVTPFDANYNVGVQVIVPDLMTTLSDEAKIKFEKAIAAAKAKAAAEAENKTNDDNSVDKKEDVAPKEETKKPEEISKPVEAPKAAEPVKEEDDDEFKEYFEMFSNPELSEKDEVTYIKKLISDKKSALVRKLVVRLATVAGAGKSNIFKSLAKKFVGDAVKVVPNGEAKTEAKSDAKPKSAESASSSKETSTVAPEKKTVTSSNGTSNGIVKESKEPVKRTESTDSQKENVNVNEKDRNRHNSAESNKSDSKSKDKIASDKISTIDKLKDESKRRMSTDSVRSNDSSKKSRLDDEKDSESKSSDHKKKKKHKHKDEERDKEKEETQT